MPRLGGRGGRAWPRPVWPAAGRCCRRVPRAPRRPPASPGESSAGPAAWRRGHGLAALDRRGSPALDSGRGGGCLRLHWELRDCGAAAAPGWAAPPARAAASFSLSVKGRPSDAGVGTFTAGAGRERPPAPRLPRPPADLSSSADRLRRPPSGAAADGFDGLGRSAFSCRLEDLFDTRTFRHRSLLPPHNPGQSGDCARGRALIRVARSYRKEMPQGILHRTGL